MRTRETVEDERHVERPLPVRSAVRRLIVPVALAVTTIAAASAAVSTIGCGDDARPDAGAGDAMPDTPIA